MHKKILKLAIPSMLALVAEPLLGIVDTALVGHLNVQSLGAMAVVTGFLTSIIWVFNFFVSGTTACTANFIGEKNKKAANSFFFQSQFLALILGLIMIIVGYFLEPFMFKVMGANEEISKIGHFYYLVRLFGFPFIFSYFVSMGYLRGMENMQTPMIITVAMNIINGVLDYFLIYGVFDFKGFGLVGASIATVFSQIVACIWYLSVIFKKYIHLDLKSNLFNFDFSIIKFIFSVNKDLFLRTLFLLSSLTFATAIATRMGVYTLGAHQIAMQIWLFCSFAIDSFAIAGQAITGKLKGMKRFKLLKAYGIQLQFYGIALGILFSLIFLFSENYILKIFTSDINLIKTTKTVFLFIIVFQPFNGITFILDGILIGFLDTKFLMKTLFLAGIVIYIPIAYFSLKLSLGLTGIWWGLTAFLFTRMFLNLSRFIKLTKI